MRKVVPYPLALLVLVTTIASYSETNRPEATAAIAGLLVAAPVLLMGRHSAAALAVAMFAGYLLRYNGLFTLLRDMTWPWTPVWPPVILVAAFVFALRQPAWMLVTGWVLTLLMVAVCVRANMPGMLLLFSLPFGVGGIIGRNFRLGQRLAVEKERGGVLTERARIARELHDVVAHHMSMIAVRAETAPYRLPEVGEDTRVEFTEISAAARQALTEMRLLLGVLRSDESTPPPTAPQPTLGDLPDLVAQARHAGAQVELTVVTGEVPQIVGVSAYRIVQEALSNVARHAPGAVATVNVRAGGEDLLVSVVNGPGTRPSPGGGSGYGLRGAAERATILGGELNSGPRPGGGWVVEARLPLSDRSERTTE
ncbi:hypothetical protein Afil01_20970 [Actinorhabdospora filicis]|uniref:histidine kinase n=1 Tax=Actinorhabdospora filicis TaxID=1785913 RepID=A0A9W6SHM2_9ACTN|nr:hypothetical protein Afil01_20970 [Actinorhabdospora filicis]